MIIGIGHDLVDKRRIAMLYQDFPQRFLERTFTPVEQAYAATKADPIPTLAKRFAAKEACAKALGTGLGEGALFTEIGVINSEKGQPQLQLTGKAAQTLAERIPNGHKAVVHLSLTDEGDFASAYVILEARKDERGEHV